jgi:ubiquinone/menaquinone biosynthesis C-methylase UbiE
MGWYGEHLLPRLLERGSSAESLVPKRARAAEGLAGRVVEIGFGTGLNVPHYPAAVRAVDAVEPNDLAWRMAGRRVVRSPVPVRRSGLDGQALPYADDTFDAALSTYTLCTVPDVTAALHELRRVLRPGARFHFLEHGLAPEASVQRWQHRLDPLQRRLVGGCHLTREVVVLLESAGFAVEVLEEFYEPGVPRPFGADVLGLATC